MPLEHSTWCFALVSYSAQTPLKALPLLLGGVGSIRSPLGLCLTTRAWLCWEARVSQPGNYWGVDGWGQALPWWRLQMFHRWHEECTSSLVPSSYCVLLSLGKQILTPLAWNIFRAIRVHGGFLLFFLLYLLGDDWLAAHTNMAVAQLSIPSSKHPP